MKIGDSLLCKRDIIIGGSVFLKDKKFLILDIFDKNIKTRSMTGRTCTISYNIIYDYFLTKKQIRKIKLEKLEDEQKS